MVLAHYIVWSIGVRDRVWTFCPEHRKLDVVYRVVLTPWT